MEQDRRLRCQFHQDRPLVNRLRRVPVKRLQKVERQQLNELKIHKFKSINAGEESTD